MQAPVISVLGLSPCLWPCPSPLCSCLLPSLLSHRHWHTAPTANHKHSTSFSHHHHIPHPMAWNLEVLLRTPTALTATEDPLQLLDEPMRHHASHTQTNHRLPYLVPWTSTPGATACSSITLPAREGLSLPKSGIKSRRGDCIFNMQTLIQGYRDHEKSGKCDTIKGKE